ncbi:hypothetical protein KKB43_02700 [Patescibacteria group bacterium]|nr:hypothetical protein [Patescibacteria group bacterium]MBU4579901.1 hypothetical protein [Patescibacteria group bacterium]
MEEIENLIIKAEWDVTKKAWKIYDIDHDGISCIYFDTRTSLLNHFGQKPGCWVLGSAIKMFAASDVRTEVYEYYFWRPKQK